MTREPDWTRQEFETLLAHPELTHEELAEVLQTRSAGAVAVVRQASTRTTTAATSRRRRSRA